jgi:hypothetical protein
MLSLKSPRMTVAVPPTWSGMTAGAISERMSEQNLGPVQRPSRLDCRPRRPLRDDAISP